MSSFSDTQDPVSVLAFVPQDFLAESELIIDTEELLRLATAMNAVNRVSHLATTWALHVASKD